MADENAFKRYIDDNGLTGYAPATSASPDTAAFPSVVKRLDVSASVRVEIARSRDPSTRVLQSGLFSGRRHILQARVPGTVE